MADDCVGCVNADRGLCRKGKNPDNAWACRTMKWYETAEQARARGHREQEAYIRGLVLEAQHQYTRERVSQLSDVKDDEA